MSNTSGLALSDVRVLDLTRAVAGPTCTRLLVEMGAEVIKIEAMPDGDFSRGVSVFKNDRSLYFMQQNRGKQSLCVNLRDPRGMALLLELVPKVDVVVENFRPGVIDAMGLGYERLRELKPDIVLCSISSFGQTGPLSDKPGYDFIGQAYSGMTSMVGEYGERPGLIGAAVGDAGTGAHAALGVLAALRRRDRDGVGDHLDVAILDTYYSYHDANVHSVNGSGGALSPTRNGAHTPYLSPCGVFRASGGFIVIMAFMHHWPDLCRSMQRGDLISHADFCEEALRIKNRAALTTIIEAWLAEFPDVASAVQVMQAGDVPCAPVLTIEETLTDDHLRARGTVRTVDDPLHGKVDIPGNPIRWKDHPNNIPLSAPLLGQHNVEVLRDKLGKDAETIDALIEAGVLGQKNC